MRKFYFRSLFTLAILGASLIAGPAWAQPAPDGFYSVVRKEAPGDAPGALLPGQVRLPYNPAFLGEEDDPQEVVVEGDSVVEMQLKEPPEKRPDTTARTQFWLGVTLNDEAAVKFEEFTRDHLGGTVAVVVGGRVVTMHKIKSVITGGKVQISRCGDKGCQILFRELTDNVEAK